LLLLVALICIPDTFSLPKKTTFCKRPLQSIVQLPLVNRTSETDVSNSMSPDMVVIILGIFFGLCILHCVRNIFSKNGLWPLLRLASCLFPRHASVGHPFIAHRGLVVESHKASTSLASFFPLLNWRTRRDFSGLCWTF
jgi:hypothetical protein